VAPERVFLGIDPGSRRVGVAVSDPKGKIALPLTVIDRETEDWIQRVGEIVAERGVDEIVVGLPVRLDGTEGSEAEASRAAAEELRSRLGVEVTMFDERLTTASATRSMRESGVTERRARGSVDRVAAALILQTYLDRQG
jgi:putative Holliday junction resolvase